MPNVADRRRGGIGSIKFAILSVLLLSAGVAHANAIGEATSLQYSLPDTDCDGLSTSFGTVTNNWRGEVDNHSTLSANDGTIFWTELADVSLGGTDNVNSNIDTADIAWLATHGSGWTTGDCNSFCYYYEGLMQGTTRSGNPVANTCIIKTSDMRLGNGDIEYFDYFGCNSLELVNSIYDTAAAGLHQYHGYSGTTAVGSGTEDYSDDYIYDSYDISIAESWVILMTDFDHWGGPSDACAVAAAWGTSASDAQSRTSYERYGTGSYTDANTSYSNYIFFNDCDPPSPIPGPMSTWY